ncbi:MAG: PEGA domain-containing protein [Acidobacteriota bacterium]|nr:MAG: PEGA domain-containing protein [Acidobacteriota bacterium]
MTSSKGRFYIREADGTRRRVETSAFPLAVGGTNADIAIAVSGPNVPEPLAHLALSDGEVFVQPNMSNRSNRGRVLCNGDPVASSQWLRDGDVLSIGGTRIEIEARDNGFLFRIGETAEKTTDPPILEAVSKTPIETPKGETVNPIAFTPTPLSDARRPRRRLGVGALIFWGALVFLAALAWALFNARAVIVEIDPVPENVVVEGSSFVVELGGRFWMHPGTYAVVAEKEGYRRLEAPIEVGEARSQTYEFSMQQLPGRLAITTIPNEEASVTITIDGAEVGTSPMQPVELEPGEHQVLIRAPGYRDFQTEVVIEGEGTIVNLEASLEPRWAPITFQSKPPGASVRVAGKPHGPTPVTVNVIEGTHDYVVVLDGYKPYRGSVHVAAGQPQTLSAVPLSLVEGTIALLSNPDTANVTLDGAYLGQTPLDVQLTPGKKYQLEVSRAGYDSVIQEVTVASSAKETMTVRLEPRLGEVALVVDPPDAELYIDGELRGAVTQVLNLPATPHRIEVKKDAYESFSTDITPRPGFPQTIEVNLKTKAEIKAASILPVIQTSKGHELRLIGPKRFEMGASRREPGRRANESLRTVELTRSFYLSTMEITNRQFREFRNGHRSGDVSGHNLEIDHHPVVRVTWQDAAAYCNWLSQQESLPPAYVNAGGKLVAVNPPTTGYRLPTEAEWARAARYAGDEKLKYPWGNALPVAPGSGNYADESAKGLVTTTVPNYNDKFPVTAPVDSFPANELGMFNLGGNVAEWVHDLYTIYPSGARKVMQDPMGPTDGEFHTIRGASWMHGSVTQLRLSFRDYGNKPRPDVGFRIARYLE